MKIFVGIRKHEFSKKYQCRIEEAEREHVKHITGDSPKRIHYWPMPKRRSDFRKLKQKLRDRLWGPRPKCDDYEWTKLKLEEAEDALQEKNTRRALCLSIVILIVAIAGVVVTVV